MKRRSRKQKSVARGEQFDMFDAKAAPVRKLTMRAYWDDWSNQYIPHRSTPRVELDIESEVVS